MTRVSNLLTEAMVSEASAELEKLDKNSILGRKLYAVVSAKQHGIKKVAEIRNISRASLTSWINKLSVGSPKDLEPKPRKPRSPIIAGHEATIKGWLSKDSNLTIKALRIRIEEELGIKISKSTVHRLIWKLEFAYITPRPVHHNQKQGSHEEFKKKSVRSS